MDRATRQKPGARRAPTLSSGGHPLQGAFGGALVALVSAVGALVAGRAIVAVELPGVRSLVSLPPLPRVTFGVDWSGTAIWPTQLQQAGLTRVAGVSLGLVLAVVSVAILNAVVLLAEAGASRRREMAVRAALGAGPLALLRLMLRDLRVLLASALALGVALGLAVGGALRASWPGTLVALRVVVAAGSLLPVVLGSMALAFLGYVAVGLRAGSGRILSRELTSGTRITDEGRAVALRRMLSAFQMAVAGSVLCGMLALARAGGSQPPQDAAADAALAAARNAAAGADVAWAGGASVVRVHAPGLASAPEWTSLLERLRRVPGLEAESLATPGALLGLGVHDYALSQCGRCVRGEFVLPLVGAVPAHHAVGPGFFAATGWKLEEGREFTAADRAGAPRVAVVNRSLASSSFENGEALGHQIRIGTDPRAWYTVVGVVADGASPVVGGGAGAPDAVFLSALQQPPAYADVILRGSPDSVRSAVAVLDAAGWAPGPITTVAARRERAAATLRWVSLLSLGLGLLTLVLALHGMHVTARQVTRRRMRELAIRRVLGASDRQVLRHAVAGTLRGAAWGAYGSVLGGTLVVALLEKAASGVSMPGPGVFAGIALILATGALMASAGAALDQLRVEPGAAVE